MRRKPGQLLALEVAILEAALDLRGAGKGRFHGFRIAKVLAVGSGATGLTAHGTLYKRWAASRQPVFSAATRGRLRGRRRVVHDDGSTPSPVRPRALLH